jgi:hypothetical protein
MPGARTHPLPCVQNEKTHAGQHRYAEITPALPAQWSYGCSVISPANQLFCHRRLQVISQACPLHWRDRTTRLDRTHCVARLATRPRPSHPAPTNRGDREPPLLESAG